MRSGCRSAFPAGGISGKPHRENMFRRTRARCWRWGTAHTIGQVKGGSPSISWIGIELDANPEGSEAIATHLPQVRSSIRMACRTRFGMSAQNTLSGQSLQQGREGVDLLLPLSLPLHCGDRNDVGNGFVAVHLCSFWLRAMIV